MENQQMKIVDIKFKHLEHDVSIMLHTSRIEDSLKHALYQRQLLM